MTFPDPDDRGPQFPSFLGDLMNMLGNSAPDQWGMTRSFALNVATGGTPEPTSNPWTGSASRNWPAWPSCT